MAATDAKAIPIKNAAYRVTFPILDADGDLVTGATGLDSEVSIDAGTFADATAEATEIATGSGVYYLDLTAAEMNGDTIAVIVKTTSTGAKTTPLVLYTAARSINDLATPTNITAATGIVLSGVTHTGAVIPEVGSVTGAVGSVTGLTASNLDATVSSRATPAQILTTALTESYAADGVAPTLAQALFLIQQSIGDFSIAGTTLTVKRMDGTTTAATYTLDDATNPTSRTRAT